MSAGTPQGPSIQQLLQQAEQQVATAGSGGLHQVHWWSRSETWATAFSPAEDVVDTFLAAVTQRITDDTKVKELIDVIKNRRDKVPTRTGITDQILSICQQILAFGAAGLALAIGFLDKIRGFSLPIQKLIAVAGIFYLELIALSLLVLVWYMLQAHFRYPFLYFRKIGNAWPYFYYPSITEVTRRPIQFARARFSSAVSYAGDYLRFANRCLQEQPRDRLRAELQQYFLLMAYSGYVQQFSLRLTNLFAYGFAGAVLSTSIFLTMVLRGWL